MNREAERTTIWKTPLWLFHTACGWNSNIKIWACLPYKKLAKPLLIVRRHILTQDLFGQNMFEDRIEGLGNLYGSYEGSKGRFDVNKAFECSLHE